MQACEASLFRKFVVQQVCTHLHGSFDRNDTGIRLVDGFKWFKTLTQQQGDNMEQDTTLLGLLAALVVITLIVIVTLRQRGGSGAASAKGSASGKHVQVQAESSGKPVARILYGTQTGTAERFSKSLGAEIRRKYGDCAGACCVQRVVVMVAVSAAVGAPSSPTPSSLVRPQHWMNKAGGTSAFTAA